ncbi:hypothetical protein BHE74_00037785 [Ensete ventricosum]|nr:hypothetical protein BHE74_00037785 [Ensete ventricosum]
MRRNAYLYIALAAGYVGAASQAADYRRELLLGGYKSGILTRMEDMGTGIFSNATATSNLPLLTRRPVTGVSTPQSVWFGQSL